MGWFPAGSNCWLTQFSEYLMALSCTAIISLQQSFYTVTSVITTMNFITHNLLSTTLFAEVPVRIWINFPALLYHWTMFLCVTASFPFLNCEQRSCLHVHRSHKYLCFIWLFSQAIESKDTPQHHRDQLSKVIFQYIFYYFCYDRWFTLKWFDRYYPRLKEKKKLV